MISGTIIGEISRAVIWRLKGTCGWVRPIDAKVPNDTAISVAKGAHDLRVELRAGTLLDFAVPQLESGYVDAGAPDFVEQLNGVGLDRVFAKFKVSFGVAPGQTQGPTLDTIVMPYEKLSP